MNTQKRDIFEMWAENGDLDRILAFIRDCARKLVRLIFSFDAKFEMTKGDDRLGGREKEVNSSEYIKL